MAASNWITVTESTFPWEREALEFVRSQLPKHEPWRAWSNFEFIADDGTINEVDLLVFSPQGFFLIEIKSRPGRLSGDAGTWTWEKDGKLATADNPLILANSKAKKLRSLLQRQKASKKRDNIPFIDALVFCSADDLRCELRGTAAYRVCLRDRAAAGDKPARPGIMAAIQRRECPGVDSRLRGKYDKPTARIVIQALTQAGIRKSQRSRKVSDYLLEQLIDEGPGYQDWQATHTTLKNVRRRVRIYNIRTGASADERETIERAARREAELLETLQHTGILRREGFTEHELGPALIFEHDRKAVRLDHFLTENHANISVDQRLDLVRQLADVVRFAHQKRVVHRALSPRSILINADDPNRLRLKVFNWQVGYRDGGGTTGASQPVSATSHVDRLVEDASTSYMAPEALSDDGTAGEHLDIFSLGAIAYHVFSGQRPAADGLELSNKLRETKGLQISSVLNGAGETLQEMIHWATLADVGQRVGLISTVDDFVDLLDKVEEEATTPSLDHFVDDPNCAKKDDLFVGGYRVIQRLGKGASSVGLLIENDKETFVLKAACDPDQNSRLKDEADVIIKKLRHQHVVEFCGECWVGDHFGFLMRPVMANIPGEDRAKKTVETLGKRLRREGRLHIDLLQRFGDDFLGVVNYLEEQGIPHRDIKPDNIAIGHIGGGKRLHLLLFDFSLSRTPADNIRGGTIGYLDPLLPLRKPPRWDLHAERYAAAATLYELAAGPGNLPKWGEGASAAHVDYEATIDGDLFDASLRDNLTEFFTRAFRRDPSERFDNAEQMLEAWRDCFVGIDAPGTLTEHDDEGELQKILQDATYDTLIHELGLGTRATNALDRANVLTVEDLLTIPSRKLMKQRGVGNKTRREILAAVRILRKKLGEPKSESIARFSCEGLFLPMVGNLGVRLPIEDIATRLRRPSKIRFLAVDGAQALAHVPVSIDAIGCDVFLAGCHKWVRAYNPLGIALLGNPTTRMELRADARRAIATRVIDDPLMRMTTELEVGSLSRYGETVNLLPLFTGAGALQDLPIDHGDMTRKRDLPRRNAERLRSMLDTDRWRFVEPVDQMRSGVCLLAGRTEDLTQVTADELRRAFHGDNVAVTTYPQARVRLSMPVAPWTDEQVAVLLNAFRGQPAVIA